MIEDQQIGRGRPVPMGEGTDKLEMVKPRKFIRTVLLAIVAVSSIGLEPASAAGTVTDAIVFTGVAKVTKGTTLGDFKFEWASGTCKIESGGTVEDCTTALSNATVTTSNPCPGVTSVKGTVTITRASGTNTIQGTMTSTNIFGIGVISGSQITRGGTGSYTATGSQASTFKDSQPSPPPADNPCSAPEGTIYRFDSEGTITISH